jgi:hypothetical protein
MLVAVSIANAPLVDIQRLETMNTPPNNHKRFRSTIAVIDLGFNTARTYAGELTSCYYRTKGNREDHSDDPGSTLQPSEDPPTTKNQNHDQENADDYPRNCGGYHSRSKYLNKSHD